MLLQCVSVPVKLLFPVTSDPSLSDVYHCLPPAWLYLSFCRGQSVNGAYERFREGGHEECVGESVCLWECVFMCQFILSVSLCLLVWTLSLSNLLTLYRRKTVTSTLSIAWSERVSDSGWWRSDLRCQASCNQLWQLHILALDWETSSMIWPSRPRKCKHQWWLHCKQRQWLVVSAL